MGGIFSSKPSAPAPAPVTPSEDPEKQRLRDEAAAKERRRRLAAGGRGSTILSSAVEEGSSVSTKKLLGA